MGPRRDRAVPYGEHMDIGRAVIGASAVGAVVLAVGFGVVTGQGDSLTTEVQGGGVCGTYPDGTEHAAVWFEASFDNDTDHGVRVRGVQAVALHRVTLTDLAIAPHPEHGAPGLIATDDTGIPDEYGQTLPVDSGYVVPAHGHLDVVGHLDLRDGADAGRLHGLSVTSTGLLGVVHTVIAPISFGVGIGTGHEERDIGCIGA